MNFVFNSVCLLLLIPIAICAIPGDIRALIAENCRNSNGQIRPRYVLGECVAVAKFYGQFLFAAFLLACLGLFLLTIVDGYIKLNIVKSAVVQTHWDPDQMLENLTSHPHNVKNEFTNYHLTQGGTKESARSTMFFLWSMLPVAVVVSFACLLLGLNLISNSYNEAVKSLVKDEMARDMRRIRRRYLRSTVQGQERIRREISNEKSLPSEDMDRVIV